jgi:uncharacterized protein (DUF1810 family)
MSLTNFKKFLQPKKLISQSYMDDNYKLIRFLEAQNQVYLKALFEIKKGQKQSHWMWYIFPQLAGLGSSENARYFSITGLAEATAYLQHPILGKHLLEITEAVLAINGKSASDIFGYPDDLKLHSSMTLFSLAKNTNPVFTKVIDKYFDDLPDRRTLELLDK